VKNVCHFFAVYVIRPATIEGARNDIHGAGMTYTSRGQRPADRGRRMTYTARRRRRQPTDPELPAGDRRHELERHGPRPELEGGRIPAQAPRPKRHGPRLTYHGHRSTARGPWGPRQAREINGRPIGPGTSGRERRELERRAAGGSDTGRRSGELEGGPSSTGAAPERAKKRAGAWPALEGGLSRAGC
jgi:hypothetical protein